VSLTVLNPGFQTLLVDGGRSGTRHLGVPLGGPADRTSFAFANGLVGNPANTLSLEVTLLGPTLRAEQRTACAFCGAPFGLAIANRGRVLPGSTFTLEPGDVLRIAGTACGARAYLSVAGGFESPLVLGSRSALEPLAAGQVLGCQPSKIAGRSLPFEMVQPVAEERLSVVPGPQHASFLKADAFSESVYIVSAASDRMGVRLTGPPLERRAGELASEAVAPGAVQITNDGQPIVLGVDGQTIGGYPKIAHVLRADLDRLAHLKPGDRVRFCKVTADRAAEINARHAANVREWLTRLAVTAPRIE